jgi:hypothetical protein
MSVNELVMQNICHHHYLQPWGVGGRTQWTHVPTEPGFAVSDRFLTTSFDPNMGHTLRLFNTLPEERRQSMVF